MVSNVAMNATQGIDTVEGHGSCVWEFLRYCPRQTSTSSLGRDTQPNIKQCEARPIGKRHLEWLQR